MLSKETLEDCGKYYSEIQLQILETIGHLIDILRICNKFYKDGRRGSLNAISTDMIKINYSIDQLKRKMEK